MLEKILESARNSPFDNLKNAQKAANYAPKCSVFLVFCGLIIKTITIGQFL